MLFVDEFFWYDVFLVDFGLILICFEMWFFFGGIFFVIFENDFLIFWLIFVEFSLVFLKFVVLFLYLWFFCWNICKVLGCICILVIMICNI